ncbi:MAG: hypothetical protein M1486_07000, partial [Gammaproteobacteria bacterium]|nr:hypothetical protein [Gammaproteobacteria bacterium]
SPYAEQYPATVPKNLAVFPWSYNVIPSKVNEPPQPNPFIGTPTVLAPPQSINPALPATIDGDAYHKLNSVSAYLPYCIGFEDPINLDSQDPRVTVFASNLQDRGFENYRKKVYMSALTADLMPNYAEKIDSFLNEVYLLVTNYPNTRPVLSTFKESLVRFFLAMHVGYDDYPEYVIKYFTIFTDAVGLGIPTDPEFIPALIYCRENIDCVNKYFEKRNKIVIQTSDNTSILYYWHLSGLPPAAIISEAVHNIIAFNQFLNVLFLAIRDQYGIGTVIPKAPGSVPPVELINYNFFTKICQAGDDSAQQLNVVRELYRLTVPNAASFSRLESSPPDNNVVVQTRHIHQAMMFLNDPTYKNYKPDQIYQNFQFSFTDAFNTTCPVPPCPKCPYIIPTNPMTNINPATRLDQSTIDKETVIDLCGNNAKAIPVYANGLGQGPIYAPFGLGYRRCAGETFSYFVTIKMLVKFKDIGFSFTGDPTRKIAVAPFTLVPDNIVYDPSVTPAC